MCQVFVEHPVCKNENKVEIEFGYVGIAAGLKFIHVVYRCVYASDCRILNLYSHSKL